MTPEQFAYWMQGFAEISGEAPTAAQWRVIKDHLETVFQKVTPRRNDQTIAPQDWARFVRPNGPFPLDMTVTC